MSEEQLIQQVEDIINKNVIKGYSKTFQCDYQYIKPSEKTYPYQYFWDTCFHVFILVALGRLEFAKQSIRSLFKMQSDEGFVGNILYWNNVLPARITDLLQSRPGQKRDLLRSHMSSLLQPPLVAEAVQRIFDASHDQEFVREMVPKLKHYYNWLAQNRSYDDSGLLFIISYFESGMDWKASFDPVLNYYDKKASWKLFLKVVYNDLKNFLDDYRLPKIYQRNDFIVKDAGFNSIYAQNLRALSNLCRNINDPDWEKYEKLSQKVTQSILEVMYDQEEAAFFDVFGHDNKKLKTLTPTIFFPIVLENIPKEISLNVIKTHFFNKEEFHTRYPIPSLAVNDACFNPNQSLYLWRGPTWISNNWFLFQYFLENDARDEAQKIIESIKKLITKSGFREYYNPFSGEGYGAKDFTWAGLILDMIRMEKGELSAKSLIQKSQKRNPGRRQDSYR